MCVSGLRFINCAPGQKEVRFAWQHYEEFARIRVGAGPPSKIIIQDGPEMVSAPNCPSLVSPHTSRVSLCFQMQA